VDDEDWERLRAIFPRRCRERLRRSRNGGRPRIDDRRAFEAVLWLMAAGKPLRALPVELGRRSTVSRWIEHHHRSGRLVRAWRRYLEGLGRSQRALWKQTRSPRRRDGLWRAMLHASLAAVP
jgi:putative transposase